MPSDKQLKEQFGARIKQLRDERSWSQAQLSHEADLDPGYIGKIERGLINPGLTYLHKIASAFGITVSELLKY
jgi:transcriptional regulator with XRE-family HTH domain